MGGPVHTGWIQIGMIHYQLRCDQGHGFDGWFRDAAGFDLQAGAGLVECPDCGSVAVERALMAPAIAKPRKPPAAKPPAAEAPSLDAPVATLAGPVPARLFALLQRMRAEVEANCDYVGENFAEEARRLAREAEAEDTTPRGIYGEATEAEAEALRDEGIDIGQLPWVPRADG